MEEGGREEEEAEAPVVMQAGKVGVCLQRREELEHLGLGSAPAVVRIALELLGQPARMGEDTLRVVSEGLPPHVEAASREAPRNARTVLQLVLRAGHTRAWVRGRAGSMARLPRHAAHGFVWVRDEHSPDQHPPVRQLQHHRRRMHCYAGRCA